MRLPDNASQPRVTFAVDFKYAAGTVEPDHADGMVMMAGKDPAAYDGIPPPRTSLGFVPDGVGHGARFATWPTETVSLVDGNYAEVGAVVPNPLAYTDGAFVPVRIEVRADAIPLIFDGAEQFTRSVSVPATATLGFGIGTGAFGEPPRPEDGFTAMKPGMSHSTSARHPRASARRMDGESSVAEAMGEAPFDPATGQGFGCGGCHTIDLGCGAQHECSA